MRLAFLTIAATAALVASPAVARSSCAALAVRLTPATRIADARLVSTVGQRVRPGDISYVLAEPGWRLVWATPAEAERGVFFFRRSRLIDTWGGVIAPGERAETAQWARSRPGGGPSPRLSACFADAVAAGK